MQPDRRDVQAEILVKEAAADIKAAKEISISKSRISETALERVWLNTASYCNWTGAVTCLLLSPPTNRKL